VFTLAMTLAQPLTNLEEVVVTVNDQPILEGHVKREALILNYLHFQSPSLSTEDQELPCKNVIEWSNTFLQSARVLLTYDLIQKAILQQAVREIPISEIEFTEKTQTAFTKTSAFTNYLKCTEQTETEWKEGIRFTLALKGKIQEIEAMTTVNQAEIENFYQARQFRYMQPARIVARMMVLPNVQKTVQILDALRKGADFATLARQNSVLGASKAGALGAAPNSTVPQPVAESQLRGLPKAMVADGFVLTRGGMTRAIKSDNKWHILQVLRYIPPAPRALEEVRPQVEKDAKTVKARGMVETWMYQEWQKASIRFSQENFSPEFAKVNGQSIYWYQMFNFYPYIIEGFLGGFFNPFNDDFSKAYKEVISQMVQQQALAKANVQYIGTRQDRLELYLSQLANNAVVSEAEAKTYYQARIKDYQVPNRANSITYFFKSEKIAQDFRKQALALGDIPIPNLADMKFDIDSSFSTAFFEKMTRSPKNKYMFVSSPIVIGTGRWTVDMIFFPVPAYTKTFEMVKDSIVQLLHKQKREGEQKRWIAKQTAEAKIENLLSEALAELEGRKTGW
jgi:parvulin-like peptidyl-prolyl isomerase